MIIKQKICTIAAMLLFFLGAGAADGEHWALALLMLAGAAGAVYIGGLDRKRTNCDVVLKEYGIK